MTVLRQRSLRCVETQALVSFDPARPAEMPPIPPGFLRRMVGTKEQEPGLFLVTTVDVEMPFSLTA